MDRKRIILGANHQFLYPAAMLDGAVHEQTLAELARAEFLDALDIWVWPEPARAAREIARLRGSGKRINYNVGDRAIDGAPTALTSTDARLWQRSLDILLREVDLALACGARKLVIGSGPDVPGDRAGAAEQLARAMREVLRRLPADAMLTLEPTDREIDKRFLFGPIPEAARFLQALRDEGHANVGLLLDMGHIPLLGQTIEGAVAQAAPVLEHVHVGNCVLRDRAHPLYGDKHPIWGLEGGEYGEADLARLLAALRRAGYLAREGATISFEMRPYEGKDALASARRFVEVFARTIAEMEE